MFWMPVYVKTCSHSSVRLDRKFTNLGRAFPEENMDLYSINKKVEVTNYVCNMCGNINQTTEMTKLPYKIYMTYDEAKTHNIICDWSDEKGHLIRNQPTVTGLDK